MLLSGHDESQKIKKRVSGKFKFRLQNLLPSNWLAME